MKKIHTALLLLFPLVLVSCKGENVVDDDTNKEEINEKYEVSFVFDGVTLYKEEVNKGSNVTYFGDTPRKLTSFSDPYDYLFFGWDASLKNVTSNLEVHPVFTKLSKTIEEEGDYTYKALLNENNEIYAYEVYQYNNFNDEVSVTLPSKYKGYDILALGEAAFMDTPVKGVVVPEGYKVIEQYAFNTCELLESVTFPSSLEILGYASFFDTPSIEEIDIKNISFLGEDNFHLCTSLKSFKVNEENKFFSSYKDSLYSKDYSKLIKVPENISSFELHENVSLLKKESISRIVSLDEIILPYKEDISMEEKVFFENKARKIDISSLMITSLEKSTFESGINLETLLLPSTLVEIKEKALYKCSSLKSLSLPNKLQSLGEFSLAYLSSLTSLNIPKNLSEIGYGALDQQSNIVSYDVNEYNTSFSSYKNALYSKDYKTLVKVPESSSSFMFHINTTVINEGAFLNTSKITNIVIPSSITSIGEYAFYLSSSITSITIPNSVTEIGVGAFSAMEKLNTISFPSSFEVLPEKVCEDCVALKNITFPENVKTISSKAFMGCESLEEIHLPGTIKDMLDRCFYDCINLERVYLDMNESTFKNVNLKDAGFNEYTTFYVL